MSDPRRTIPVSYTHLEPEDEEGHGVVPGIIEEDSKIHPLLGRRICLAGSRELRFQSRIGREQPAFLDDHQLFHKVVLPMSAYLETALAAGEVAFRTRRLVLEEVVIHKALVLPQTTETVLQTVLVPDTAGAYRFEIYSLASADSWTLHAVGRVSVSYTHLLYPCTQSRSEPQDGTCVSPCADRKHYPVLSP